MRHTYRNKQGQFAPIPARVEIVKGRLYDFHGTVVRARHRCSDGQWHVSYHNQLFGFAPASELKLIGPERVQQYLAQVGIKPRG